MFFQGGENRRGKREEKKRLRISSVTNPIGYVLFAFRIPPVDTNRTSHEGHVFVSDQEADGDVTT
jgi:hypothetical protein